MPISCYKSTLEDGAAFSALINSLGGQSLYRALYGQYNYTSLVEYTYLSVSAKNEEGVVGGFVSLNDGLPGDIEPFHDFLEKIALAAPGCSVLNSLVVNFFAYNVKVCGPDAGKDILRNAFSCCPSLHYIFWLCPANAKAPPFISTYFAEAAVDNQSDLFKKNKLFMVQRDDFLPELLVREARVEDNDDLLPILQTSNPGVMDGHDDFFLADMIQAQDERNKIFVGVSGDKPVGMLATSLDVNAALISRVFDLELYSGLVSGGAELARQTQLAVLVLGESNLVSSCNLKEMSSILGGNFLDVSAFGGTATVDADRVIDAVVGMPLSASAFCFIVGYPKNEGEAKEFITTLTSHEMRLVVVEIQSHSLDADDVERPEVPGGEDHEELLLDAVEYLRSHLLRADDTEAELNPVRNVDWIKVDITESVETVGKGVGAMKKKMEEIIELHRLTLAEIGDDLDGSAVANAFAITLFCIEEGYESRSEDMLRVAFEENPSLDYCLLMLPNDVSTPAIASCMACPHVRPGVSFDQSLFLAHRDYLLANNFLQLERYTPRDQPLFEEFVGNVSGGANGVGITAAFEHSLKEADVPLSDNPSEASFIATIQGVIVGAISISRRVTTTDDIVWMRQNYLIDNVVNFERHRSRSQAMITHWVMNPIFSKSARLVLREVMRQFQKTLLYYECKGGNIPSPEALYEMIPVKPRIYVRPLIPDGISADIIAAGEIDDGKEHSNPKSSSQRKREAPLFVMTKMELINSKNLVSKRIVIVGGNSSAFSALETLCFSRDKYLSNIYYVTEMDNFRKCGEFAIDTNASERNNLRGTLSVKDFGDPTRSYLDALGIANRIIIVSGRLTDIDRKSKAIVISDDIALEYDVLVIASASQDASFKQIASLAGFHPVANMERGVFGLGNQMIDAAAENWIKCGRGNAECDKIVISGPCENAIVVLGRLLELGISPGRLVWLAPLSGDSLIELGHGDVNEMAENALHGLNIAIYQGIIEDLNLSEENGTVTGVLIRRKRLDTDMMSTASGDDGTNLIVSTVEITSETEAKEYVSCKTVLLCNNVNNCDIDLFAAVKDCGLVFDGGVIVDKSFRTVDECIYAVGPFTKYSRRYRNAPKHASFNARELGHFVADEVLRNQLSLLSSSKAPTELKAPFDLKEFMVPKIIECSLPGGLFFYKSVLPDQFAISTGDTARALTTRCVDPENVTVVKFNALGIVVEIIYIGVDPVENSQMGRLVGMHEGLLNSAVFSFEKALIKDWQTFFRGEWASALLHDDFENFKQSLVDPVHGEKFVLSLMDSLSEKVASGVSDEDISKATSQILGDRCAFVPENVCAAIETPLMEFVKKYKSDFSKFQMPIMSQSNRSGRK